MNRIFKEILNQSKEDEKLIAIFTDKDESSRFMVGIVVNFGFEIISIRHISPEGFPDGIKTINVEDVNRIVTDDNYLKKLEIKMDNLAEIFIEPKVPDIFNDPALGFESILKLSKEEKKLIHINFDFDSGVYGIVEDIDDEEFLLREFDSYGEYDGLAAYKTDAINDISWDDEDNRTVEILIRRKNTGDLRIN